MTQVIKDRENSVSERNNLYDYVILFPSLAFSLFSTWALLRLPGNFNPFSNVFRGYFPSDQLSYAGIASSAKSGSLGLVEPFTQTGSSFYPSWWYKFIGLFANLTGMDISASWSVLGFSVVFGAVTFIGIAAWQLSGKPWAPITIGILLWIGPLASIFFDNWFITLDSHAVLWGPYGALYPLNGEVAGLMLGSSALILGYWVISRPTWPRWAQYMLMGASGLLLGIVANFQTYSFLTLTAVALWILAVGGLLRHRSRRLLIATAGLLVIVLFGGSVIRGAVGALPIYALMLIPTLPALWALARSRFALAATGFALFVLGASPQIIWMISGTLDNDPFLTYRVDQSGDLGIPFWSFIVFGAPVLVTWGALLRVQVMRQGAREIALLIGWLIAFILLAFNDAWGFSQEPYRFWINSVIVFVFIAAITLPCADLKNYFSTSSSRILSTFAAILVAASIWNVGSFRSYVSSQGNINFESAQFETISDLVENNYSAVGLLSAEPCIDPRHLKVVTGVPVAFYNLGLAWPEKKTEIDAVITAADAGVLDTGLMRTAGISYLLTDSTCPTGWDPSTQMGVAKVAQRDYLVDADVKTLTLWRLF